MSVALGTFLGKTPKPCSPVSASPWLSLPSRTAASTPLPSSLRLARRGQLSLSGLLPIHLRHPSVVSFAASHEESKHSDVEVEKEEDDLKREAAESEEAWKQTLDAFKEQALKMQSISQEAYEVYSEKAMVILKETSEQLKIQAEKARYDLSTVAKEISEEGKEYLSAAAENSPEPVKEIVETFSSPTDDLNDVSQVRDFYLGIPYGLLLSLGGFLSFVVTGSIPAIRFGVILGGTLLALSISSLRSYRKGKSSPIALKGQAGIAGVIFLREVRLLSKSPSLCNFVTAVVSGAMVAFYLYRIKQNGQQKKSTYEDQGMET
ncbi:protein FATTY ACID EXPORT 3, chloroplastic [Punica granatum]|uniref:Protein FATTY ACID EXPORT 3, chloroplastic n=2 Tax=Punica granatum TaxID=22663 RepID=A0A6P8DQG5_PUNGR|nr:protein FATTY ACID EXPORT 3, chloroplastic [Punica granatum]XP_031398295.1 protein FATTY ACID EXPORT 3, chloroplastic [Punica granatum]OWM67051.1 hypothetical protein CDL15_Pgr000503 [Punica granatum]PKI37994.1 hypothetical protein CRG98_041590 [Punica granatum]